MFRLGRSGRLLVTDRRFWRRRGRSVTQGREGRVVGMGVGRCREHRNGNLAIWEGRGRCRQHLTGCKRASRLRALRLGLMAMHRRMPKMHGQFRMAEMDMTRCRLRAIGNGSARQKKRGQNHQHDTDKLDHGSIIASPASILNRRRRDISTQPLGGIEASRCPLSCAKRPCRSIATLTNRPAHALFAPIFHDFDRAASHAVKGRSSISPG